MNTMTAVQAGRMNILADFVEGEDLDMRNYVHNCGSPSCALGWARVIPALQSCGVFLDVTNAGDIFGLNSAEKEGLFHSQVWGNYWGRNNVTGKEWATKAREILAAHGYPAVVPKPVDRIEEPSPHLTALLQRLTAPVRVRG